MITRCAGLHIYMLLQVENVMYHVCLINTLSMSSFSTVAGMEAHCKALNCSHGCKETNQTYACFCRSGYNLTTDGMSCQGTAYAFIIITCLSYDSVRGCRGCMYVIRNYIITISMFMVMVVITLHLHYIYTY